MKTEILSVLRETDEFVSGQELCRRLGKSRTAVWKTVKSLREEGYGIEAVQNRGYRLTSIPDVLSADELRSRLGDCWAGREVYYYGETDSTNTRAKRLAEEGACHGALVCAGRQTAGKGRRGRSWQSPEGASSYMTLLLRPQVEPDSASMLTLIMALGVANAVRELTGLEAMIKWPNDVVVNRKKVCGILTEMSLERDYIQYVVIGSGVNIREQEFPGYMAAAATSLERELRAGGKECLVGRADMIESSVRHFARYYEIFEKTTDLSALCGEYNEYLVNRGARVKVLSPGEEYEGTAVGINGQGELLVDREDGGRERVYAGEVSVRGIYGYV